MKREPQREYQQSPFFVPPAAVTFEETAGYLQVSIGKDGTLAVRGTRALLEWFLHQLAAEGWQIAFDDIHWCG